MLGVVPKGTVALQNSVALTLETNGGKLVPKMQDCTRGMNSERL